MDRGVVLCLPRVRHAPSSWGHVLLFSVCARRVHCREWEWVGVSLFPTLGRGATLAIVWNASALCGGVRFREGDVGVRSIGVGSAASPIVLLGLTQC